MASEELLRQGNIFRHEEIIEEVEVILLSAVSLDEQSFQGKRTTNHLHSTFFVINQRFIISLHVDLFLVCLSNVPYVL
jgi:hypothetical protein